MGRQGRRQRTFQNGDIFLRVSIETKYRSQKEQVAIPSLVLVTGDFHIRRVSEPTWVVLLALGPLWLRSRLRVCSRLLNSASSSIRSLFWLLFLFCFLLFSGFVPGV